jgi:Ca-activated chloride channel family protein
MKRKPKGDLLAVIALAILAVRCATGDAVPGDPGDIGASEDFVVAFEPELPNYEVAERSPEDLGLAPTGVDELWVVARDGARREAPLEEPAGMLAVRGGAEIPLPLERTDVQVQIDAYLASVDVEQRYHNPYDEKIEVVYVFPLPPEAAVSEFLMTIGERTIRGVIREREEAERIYEEARSMGFVASLLTEERPNVFRQRVANVEAGGDVDVRLTYYSALPYRDGAYVFSFPTVVGPRFNPPGSSDGIGAVAPGAAGLSGQSTEVPYLPPGGRSAHRVSFEIDLDAGVAVERLDSPTHAIAVESISRARKRITLAAGETAADRDFTLRYFVAGESLKSAIRLHEDASGGYFTMILVPPQELARVRRSPVEHVFVLDCSGSMSGAPIELAKDAVRRVLRRLGPRDTFQIIRFSDDGSALGPHPVPASPENVARGLAYLDGLEGEGGTMMIEGIKAALDFPHDEGHVRIVSFLTDGYIGNEAEIFAAVHERLGASRIFGFGVGSGPNTYLLDNLARIGRGAVAYVNGGDLEADQAAVDAFFERIAHPALSEIEIDWSGSEVSEVYPSRISDLWVGRPVVITGRVDGTLAPKLGVRGRVGGEPASFELPTGSGGGAPRPAIARIWARMKIADLAERSLWEPEGQGLLASIRGVALDYGLLSRFTAFVAVDSSRVTEGDHGTTLVQPVPVPHGVRYETTVLDPRLPAPERGER